MVGLVIVASRTRRVNRLALTASMARAMPTSTAAPAIPAVITLSAVRPRELEGDVVVVVFMTCCSLVSVDALARSMRCLAKSRTALSIAGQLFS